QLEPGQRRSQLMRHIADQPLLRSDEQLETFRHVVEVFDQLPNFVELTRTSSSPRLQIAGGDPLSRSPQSRNRPGEVTGQKSANQSGNDDGEREPFQNWTTAQWRLNTAQFKHGEITRGLTVQQTGNSETLLVDGPEIYGAWLRKGRQIHLAMARIAKYVPVSIEQIKRHPPRLDRALTGDERRTSTALICVNQKLSVGQNRGAKAAMDRSAKLVFSWTLRGRNKYAENQHCAEPKRGEDLEEQAAHITGAASPL